jgi:phosphoribosylformylglycinamidine (FGAM) synthase PurS component
MPGIDVAIELKIPDNTAFTVLTALRRLGYEDLQRVERSEHVILTAGVDESPERIVMELSRAEVLFNPNKHRMAYAVSGSANGEQPVQWEALVRDKDEDNSRLVSLLRGTFGMRVLQGLERAVGWRLYDRSGPAPRERLAWACQSLLANPVSQAYDISPRPVRIRVGELEGATAKA